MITQRNNPKVNIVAGKVKKTNMGLTNAFNKANTMATPKAPQNPFTSTPGKMYDNPMTISAVKIKLKIVLIFRISNVLVFNSMKQKICLWEDRFYKFLVFSKLDFR